VDRVRTTSRQSKDTSRIAPEVLHALPINQSVAPEDRELSKTQANEATPSFSRAGGTRASHPAPHLVGAPKPQARTETAVDGAEPAARNTSTLPLHADTHGTYRVAQARYFRGAWHEFLKRTIDILGALMIALALSPVLITVCTMLCLQGQSVIYKHRRIGRDGRTFGCLKFRTMVPNADQALRDLLEKNPELKREWVRDHKLRNDPRVTPIGRFLRRSSLDELPQLWNVLRGEMSLVGPRPIVREELLRYGRKVREYLAIKPGITGLWQVTGRNDINYRRRVALDMYYVRNQNLLLDIYILIKTTGVVLGRTGAY
jgi:exopolysaccharide production protein ExoY